MPSPLPCPVATCCARPPARAAAGRRRASWPISRLAAELKGRIKQSVCLWCYNGYMKKNNMTLDQFAAACAKLGLKSIELVGPRPVADAQEARPDLRDDAQPRHRQGASTASRTTTSAWPRSARASTTCADAGFPNVICFSGNREGMDDQEGLKNCVAGLKKIAGYAEQKKVTVCLEYLNSINHKDYMADRTQWCVDLVNRVGSPRVKVLYDIYHAAMMKEDPLADIQKHHECWGHYHTGGCPGRNEIDDTQTLDYRKIMQAIVETGYDGYVGQEFIPKNAEALKSLAAAVAHLRSCRLRPKGGHYVRFLAS